MYKFKSLALVAIVILFGGVLSSATAQRLRKAPALIEPPLPVNQILSGTYKIDVKADKLSTGGVPFRTGATYGWTCYGTTSGDLSGYIFVSMNYSAPTVSPYGVDVREVTGGSWSKLIFVKGEYAGSINGRILGGQMVTDTSVVSGPGSPTTISLQLAGDGGTAAYSGSIGSGSFEGILDDANKGSSVTGTLILNY